ncbi:hypothetical protein ONR57_13870 [Hoyosella sp. YIM 151337]|uniref:WXG100 family type VII secretion target n=1 Tax=Hoyosella sp. YIM 151337 TaxID=2992742 RepID=UPI002235ACAC|nr:hypothetical protein [Hoyosella sp. YIM 151337]MCW4354391.1 hypothetical protein [Hoyosella sp. YIM 151337]
MNDVLVDPAQLRATADTLRCTADRMTHALRELQDADMACLGSDRLAACARRLQSQWESGLRTLVDTTGTMATGLDRTAELYRTAETSNALRLGDAQ